MVHTFIFAFCILNLQMVTNKTSRSDTYERPAATYVLEPYMGT